MLELDTCLLKRSMTGPEDECGDTGVIRETGEKCFLALIDALGHGKEAHEVAVMAEEFLFENIHLDLIDLMNGLHHHLKGSRGAVATLCRLNIPQGVLQYTGVGNITTRVLGPNPYRFVSRDGIVGYMMSSPKKLEIKLVPGDILLLSSDGITEHFDMDDIPDLLKGPARDIAAGVLHNFGKASDDASCIVLRFGK